MKKSNYQFRPSPTFSKTGYEKIIEECLTLTSNTNLNSLFKSSSSLLVTDLTLIIKLLGILAYIDI